MGEERRIHPKLDKLFGEDFADELEPLFERVLVLVKQVPSEHRDKLTKLHHSLCKWVNEADRIIDLQAIEERAQSAEELDRELDEFLAQMKEGVGVSGVQYIVEEMDEESGEWKRIQNAWGCRLYIEGWMDALSAIHPTTKFRVVSELGDVVLQWPKKKNRKRRPKQ